MNMELSGGGFQTLRTRGTLRLLFVVQPSALDAPLNLFLFTAVQLSDLDAPLKLFVFTGEQLQTFMYPLKLSNGKNDKLS